MTQARWFGVYSLTEARVADTDALGGAAKHVACRVLAQAYCAPRLTSGSHSQAWCPCPVPPGTSCDQGNTQDGRQE